MNDTNTPLLEPPRSGTRSPGPAIRPSRFDLERPHRALPVLVGVSLVWAVTTSTGMLRSLGMGVALAATMIALAVSVARDRRARFLLAGASSLLPWLALRQSPWLIGVNLTVAAALLLTAATVRRDRAIAARFGDLIVRWWAALASTRFGAVIVRTEARTASANAPVSRVQAAALGRALGVGLAVCGVAVVLLASGDALFASYLDVGALSGSVINRLVAAAVGAASCSALFGMFRSAPSGDLVAPSVRPATLLVTMAGLTVTIGAYGLVQVIAATSGAEYVEQRTGLTYAEYARGGFFQLVAVTVLTVIVLTAARSTRERASVCSRPLLVLAGALSFGVVSLVTTSVVKLVVYADRFGLTMLRLYTTTFAVWLGLVAVLTFVALIRPLDRWLTPVVLLTVVIGVFGMNVVNPEQLVAEHNIARARDGAVLDLDYLERLSADALPTILAGFSELGMSSELQATARWCDSLGGERGVFAANAAVSAAGDAQRRFCSGG